MSWEPVIFKVVLYTLRALGFAPFNVENELNAAQLTTSRFWLTLCVTEALLVAIYANYLVIRVIQMHNSIWISLAYCQIVMTLELLWVLIAVNLYCKENIIKGMMKFRNYVKRPKNLPRLSKHKTLLFFQVAFLSYGLYYEYFVSEVDYYPSLTNCFVLSRAVRNPTKCTIQFLLVLASTSHNIWSSFLAFSFAYLSMLMQDLQQQANKLNSTNVNNPTLLKDIATKYCELQELHCLLLDGFSPSLQLLMSYSFLEGMRSSFSWFRINYYSFIAKSTFLSVSHLNIIECLRPFLFAMPGEQFDKAKIAILERVEDLMHEVPITMNQEITDLRNHLLHEPQSPLLYPLNHKYLAIVSWISLTNAFL